MSGFRAGVVTRGPGSGAQAAHAPAVFPMGSIFEPDVLTPHQWFGRLRSSCRSPEQTLQLAVLQAAIDDLRVPVLHRVTWANGQHHLVPHPSVELRDDALAWFAADDDDAFGFVGICESLGLSASGVRKGLGLLGDTGGRASTGAVASSPSRGRHVVQSWRKGGGAG